MIVIIVFFAVMIWVFRYNFLRFSDADSRKNTRDGYTYTDVFGNLRLLLNGKRVYYKKDFSGQMQLVYGNGCAVDKDYISRESAKFRGKDDYIYCFKNGIPLYKVIETGEIYAKSYFVDKNYYIEYNEDKPMRVVREANNDSNGNGIDIDKMNEVLKKMFEEKFPIVNTYLSVANCKYLGRRYYI